MLQNTLQNTKAQGVLIFLLITMAMMILIYMSMSALGDALSVYGAKSAVYSGFSDVANSIANDIVAIVVFLPHGAKIEYNKTIPTEIGGVIYTVTYDPLTENVIVSPIQETKVGRYEAYVYLSGIKYEGRINISVSSAQVVSISVSR